ncbi:MAG TPA: VWA domain-containing protein, partial [Thermoanaerobaculia bacterium]|nr:VWA domain-containing protein [Thermoanaerobaculia bacterium]
MSTPFRRSGTFCPWTSALVAGGALALALAVPPRGPAHPQEQDKPILQDVTVAVKLIQAYVTAKDGKPVTDLTAADFEVTDNGQVVPVTHFEKHFVGGDSTAAPPPPEEQIRANRKFFLFFDFAFIDARSALKARDAGLEFIDTKLKPGDEVGLLSYSAMRGLTIHEYLTTDHPRIRRVVESFGLKSITGRAESLTNFIYADELKHMLEINETGATAEGPSARNEGLQNLRSMDDWFRVQAMIQTGGVVDGGRTQSYVDQARAFSMTLSGLAQAMRYIPGWKNIILFSGGIARNLIHGNRNISAPIIDANNPEATAASMSAYDAAQSDSRVREEFSSALKDLKTANSPIYAIDCSRTQGEVDINNPVAASTASRDLLGKDSLVQLASESGGKYFSNSMDLR